MDNSLACTDEPDAFSEVVTLLARGVLAPLCPALVSAESTPVIDGCPVLFTCEPVADAVEAIFDDSG